MSERIKESLKWAGRIIGIGGVLVTSAIAPISAERPTQTENPAGRDIKSTTSTVDINEAPIIHLKTERDVIFVDSKGEKKLDAGSPVVVYGRGEDDKGKPYLRVTPADQLPWWAEEDEVLEDQVVDDSWTKEKLEEVFSAE